MAADYSFISSLYRGARPHADFLHTVLKTSITMSNSWPWLMQSKLANEATVAGWEVLKVY